MEEVRAGRIPFCKLDVLHRRNLDLILPRFGLVALGEHDRRALNLAWHRLDAWPEVARRPSPSQKPLSGSRLSQTATFR